jgi:hypothetical protein
MMKNSRQDWVQWPEIESATRKGGWDRTGPPVGIFWDQSLVWGLLCIETLSRAGIPYRLLSSSDIAEGMLERCRILLVPGGWAAHKVRSLGDSGKKMIAGFIETGGTYIGFCGGAGMALSSPPSIFLTSIERMPLAERLPSASGGIHIEGTLSHPCWKDIPPAIPVSVWWPSQFRFTPEDKAFCLASYTDPGTDFQVADLRVSDLDREASWPELEQAYGINLDPARIKGHPAIIEVPKGKGRMILSYAHLETPGDLWGNRLFFQIIDYLNEISEKTGGSEGDLSSGHRAELPDQRAWACICEAEKTASDLIAFGEANLLWNWRRPWLLNWRRGIRGLEYGTLAVSLSYMAAMKEKLEARKECGVRAPSVGFGSSSAPGWPERAGRLEAETREFCTLAKRLLLEEKFATQTAVLSKLGKVNDRVDTLRGVLFGNRMNHGGLCRALFDLIDVMLLDLLKSV